MGKALAAWIMVAGAVAAPAMGPRETIESAVGRVMSLLQDADAPRTESATPSRQGADKRAEVRKIARDLFDWPAGLVHRDRIKVGVELERKGHFKAS